jgi:hypothetical protein
MFTFTLFHISAGKISGTIHREVVKEYAMYIQPGTVLVLRQVIFYMLWNIDKLKFTQSFKLEHVCGKFFFFFW